MILIEKFKRIVLTLFVVTSVIYGSLAQSNVNFIDTETQKAFDLYKAGKKQEAIDIFTIKAHEGVITAKYNLAVIYAEDVEDSMAQRESLFWLQSAAEAGDSEAQFNLGMTYFGDQTDEDRLVKTIKWLTEAANGGELKAQYNLGYLAFSNLDVDISRYVGLDWLQKAANTNNDRALKLIGLLQQNKTEGAPKLYELNFRVKNGSIEANPYHYQ